MPDESIGEIVRTAIGRPQTMTQHGRAMRVYGKNSLYDHQTKLRPRPGVFSRTAGVKFWVPFYLAAAMQYRQPTMFSFGTQPVKSLWSVYTRSVLPLSSIPALLPFRLALAL